MLYLSPDNYDLPEDLELPAEIDSILHAEDEEIWQEVIEETLDDLGVITRLFVCSSSEELVSLYEDLLSKQARPTIALLDHDLNSALTGTEIGQKIDRDWGNSIPWIIVSTYGRKDLIRAAEHAGAAAWIQKKYDSELAWRLKVVLYRLLVLKDSTFFVLV